MGVTRRIGTSGKMQRIVEDKDEQISALLAEGEKLTKQQLTSNNLIKKLRKKEKEQEELSRDHRLVCLAFVLCHTRRGGCIA